MRRCITILGLLLIGIGVSPSVTAQISDVTVREINAIHPDSIAALNAAGESLTESQIQQLIFNDLEDDTVRVQIVVMSDPTLSGLSTPRAEGLPNRVHFFGRDTAAVSQGVDGMGIQIVDGNWQANGVLSLLVGDVIEIVGVVDPFDEVQQLVPTSITPLGTVQTLNLPSSIMDPVVITTADAVKVVGAGYQANWDNLSSLSAQFVRIENALVQRRDITDLSSGRPQFTFSTDGGVTQLYHREISLAFRNDRDGDQNADQFRVFFDDWVPPPPGAGINIQGFMVMDDFDGPFGIGNPDDALFKIAPFERSDIEITVTPPVVRNVTGPSGVPGPADNVDITADVFADPTRSLVSIDVNYYTSSVPDTFSVAGVVGANDTTYTFTIPPQADGDFVIYWVLATDNLGAESQPISNAYRVLDGGITAVAHIQQTVDGEPGGGPYAGLTLPMNLEVVVQSSSAESGIISVQDGTDPWSGVILRTENNLDTQLARGDSIRITSARLEESFGLTRLRDVTFEALGTTAPYDYLVVSTDVLQVPSVAEAHEGMQLRFENVVVTMNNADPTGSTSSCPEGAGFGEWAISSDGTETNQVRVDDQSDQIECGFNINTYQGGEIVDFIQGVWSYAFGNYKLWPELSADIGVVTNVATEEVEVPSRFALEQNYPNPFNPSTNIRFEVPNAAHVSIQVFDVIGRRIATLVDREMTAGTHTVTFDARSLASGMYVYRLEGAGQVINRTMMLLR